MGYDTGEVCDSWIRIVASTRQSKNKIPSGLTLDRDKALSMLALYSYWLRRSDLNQTHVSNEQITSRVCLESVNGSRQDIRTTPVIVDCMTSVTTR